MWAGTRRKVFSISVSGERFGALVADGKDPQAKTAPKATSDMAVAIVLIEGFKLSQTHRIAVVWAIQLPGGIWNKDLYFNRLWDIVLPISQDR
jgi:hypothetical protein